MLLRRVRTSICVNIQDLTNRPMTPFELIKSLRRRGLEISPSYKVSAMVDELAKNKNRTVEKHLYRCVALLAASEKFSFLHSRWNQLAGDENFVLQYQKLEKETMVGIRVFQSFLLYDYKWVEIAESAGAGPSLLRPDATFALQREQLISRAAGKRQRSRTAGEFRFILGYYHSHCLTSLRFLVLRRFAQCSV